MKYRCRQCNHIGDEPGNCPTCNIPMEEILQQDEGTQPGAAPAEGQPAEPATEPATPETPTEETGAPKAPAAPDAPAEGGGDAPAEDGGEKAA